MLQFSATLFDIVSKKITCFFIKFRVHRNWRYQVMQEFLR